jgi:hypothetical protein
MKSPNHIEFDGSVFNSVSTAAFAVTQGKRVNGWRFWYFEKDGQIYSLDTLRKGESSSRKRTGTPQVERPPKAPSSTRTRQRRSSGVSTDGDNQEAHGILDRQINHIREYLRGRVERPSDELLCEWVHFCYTFQLFKEGVELFGLINPASVDLWPYERAKRIAKICRIRTDMS